MRRIQGEQLVWCDDDGSPAGLQDPHHFTDVPLTVSFSCRRRIRLTNMFDDSKGPDQIEHVGLEGKIQRGAGHHAIRTCLCTLPAGQVAREVDSPRIDRRVRLNNGLSDGAGAAPDVERSAVLRSQMADQPSFGAIGCAAIYLLSQIVIRRHERNGGRMWHQIEIATLKKRVGNRAAPADGARLVTVQASMTLRTGDRTHERQPFGRSFNAHCRSMSRLDSSEMRFVAPLRGSLTPTYQTFAIHSEVDRRAATR